MSIAISGKIPDSLLKEIDTWNLWAEKPQLEFEDSIIAERIKKFDEQLQISTALLLELDKVNDVYNKSVLIQHPHQFIDKDFYYAYLQCLDGLETGRKELEGRIGQLTKKDKADLNLLNWIKNKNKEIKYELQLSLPAYYDELHEGMMHRECTQQGRSRGFGDVVAEIEQSAPIDFNRPHT